MTKKSKTERALAEKTAELENVLESITDAFYTVDKDWRFTYVNSEYERIQKRNRQDLLGKNIWAEFPYAAELAFYPQYHRAMAEQVSVHFEEYNPARDMWVTANAYPTASGLAIYFRDITAEKKIREQVYLDGQDLRAIINNTSDLIWSVDKQFHIITGNEAFWKRVAELTGKSAGTVTNDDFEPKLLERYIAHYQEAFTGKAFQVIRERQEETGLTIYEQLSFNPIHDQQSVIGVNCFLRDITEQQQHIRKIEKQNQCLTDIAWAQSHRVRVPLANILGLLQLFEAMGPEDQDVLQKLSAAAMDLDKVIREITGYADGNEGGNL
ncbi:PAS domain-containing protein [Mucilaginibacter ginsenosidivorax]|uniref:PAS domain-containing protein n=1 Tax=Mucilaginibacter ginsenosidivorax TaxID=862126 RepID=UPI00131532DB|nr:PAS domain-containing protein [Mucilaginibacter ginsenosidivorax]